MGIVLKFLRTVSSEFMSDAENFNKKILPFDNCVL